MATDIAFAVGVLALLGKRVSPALRVLLLALAIIDDIGAIIVIAIFYSEDLRPVGLLIAAVGLASVLILQRVGVRRAFAYVPSGVVAWYGLLHAGIHPTLAGVAMGLLTPARAWFGAEGLVATAAHVIDDVQRAPGPDGLLTPMAELDQARREAVSPVVRLQAALHPWVAFLVMPIFALANAGVAVHASAFVEPASRAAMIGIGVGLVLGKPLGILGASFLAVRLGLAALPRGTSWRGVAVVGLVAGIGFTMAIFIAGLAFEEPELLAAARVGVLLASGVAGVLALVLGRALLPATPLPIGARTASEAEASTDD
jgi:NhaA family Na+:H+ antiporter